MVQISHKLYAQNLHPQVPEVILIDMNNLLHHIAWPLAKWPYKGIRHHVVPQKKRFSPSL